MLKEISYWTYYFFLKRKYLKDGGHKSDSVMFISVCLFFNFASIIQIIEYYAHFYIAKVSYYNKMGVVILDICDNYINSIYIFCI